MDGDLVEPRNESEATPAGNGTMADVEYGLTRRSILQRLHGGALQRQDVCDAHPELLRAARNLGTPTGRACPVCRQVDLVNITYVFGRSLPRGGRCVSTEGELEKLSGNGRSVTCYVVEVCTGCAWNHLVKAYWPGARAAG